MFPSHFWWCYLLTSCRWSLTGCCTFTILLCSFVCIVFLCLQGYILEEIHCCKIDILVVAIVCFACLALFHSTCCHGQVSNLITVVCMYILSVWGVYSVCWCVCMFTCVCLRVYVCVCMCVCVLCALLSICYVYEYVWVWWSIIIVYMSVYST